MRRLYIASFSYLVVGVLAGVFYREFTKMTGFAEGGYTQLSVVHTHVLTLGFLVMLIVLVLEKLFALSRSRLFGWFFWLYNAGLVITVSMLIFHGILQVLGEPGSAAISGIAGLGHTVLTAGLVVMMIALGRAIRPAPQAENA